MKNCILSAIFIVFAIVSFPAQAQEPASMDILSAAAAKAENARSRAADFESSSYFPSDWEAAEAQFTAAEAMPVNSGAGITQAADAYNAAADAFDSIFELAIPLYALAMEDDIMVIRADLIDSGARNLFPEIFSPADKTALLAFDLYEAADPYAAKDTAIKALLMYRTLEIAFNAWLSRQEILYRDFAFYDPVNFNRAEETISDTIDAYSMGDIPAAQENAGEALLRYSLVLSNGWAAYSELRFSMAQAERQAIMDNQADIELKHLIEEGESIFDAGIDLFNSENYEEAAQLFIDAEALFVIARTNGQREPDPPATETVEAKDASAQTQTPGAALPATYTVRTWASSRDCFWVIAAYPWVYGDPEKWRLLYNANKSKLPKPDNPDLLLPGTVLDIPSIRGETRQGAWDSSKTY